jgi:membrane protein YqaA with SNARE-associated domain
VLLVAAVLGDAVNYAIGARLAHRFLVPDGERVAGPLGRLVKREHVAQAHEFFVKHGGKAVVLARFVPIVRTFLPFVAGASNVGYYRGEVGVSAGLMHRFDGDFAVTAGVSYAGGKNTAVKAGVAGEF